MTSDRGASEPDATPLSALPASERRRLVLAALARIVLVSTLLLVAYFQLPIGRHLSTSGVVVLGVSIAAFVAAIAFQIRRITEAQLPTLRGVETLGTAVPVFIVMFSVVYFAMAHQSPGSFDHPLTRMGALYFTISVLTSVGFGDIAARSDAAMAVVSVQMLMDLLLLGVIVRLVVRASRAGTARRRAEGVASGDPGE